MKKLITILTVLCILSIANAQEEDLSKNAKYLYEKYNDPFNDSFIDLAHKKLKNNRKAQKKEKVYSKLMTAELNSQSDAIMQVRDSLDRIMEERDTISWNIVIPLIQEMGQSNNWYFDEELLEDDGRNERERWEDNLSERELSLKKVEDNIGGLIYLHKWSEYNPKYKERYLEPLMNIKCDWVLLLHKYEEKLTE